MNTDSKGLMQVCQWTESRWPSRAFIRLRISFAGILILGGFSWLAQASGIENLAPKARITANSELSQDYQARFVTDGRIPEAGGKQDVGQAWCVNGQTHRGGAQIEFRWPAPVSIAEVVYYGRTAWFLDECWKEYELLVGDATAPAAKGEFKATEGPQRIVLPTPITTDRLTLKFTSSHGGFNPGASEIQIFSAHPSERDLQRLAGRPATEHEKGDVAAVRELISALSREHGSAYAQSADHRRRLELLEKKMVAGEDAEEALAQLRRDVLLFDIDQLLVIRRVEINASHVYTYHNEDFHAGGGLYVISPRSPDGSAKELVAAEKGQMLDCDLDYDGKTALFSWRQLEDQGYHVWKVQVDGTGRKQISQGEWHDYNASWLPDGGISFVSSRSAQFAYCWNSPVGVLHRMDATGANLQRLSGNYLNDFTPYPLADGRIIYSRWEYVDKPAIPIQSLWTINPDGTGMAGYFGNRVISPATFMEVRPIPGSSKIICTMTGHNGPARGAIGIIDRTLGVNAQEAIQNVTPDVPVPGVGEGSGNFDGAKFYSSPYPLDRTRFLVSARGPVLVRDYSGKCVSVALPAPGKGLQYFCAQPIRARTRPPIIPARFSIAEASADQLAQTTPAIPAAYSPDEHRPMAYLYLQDVYNGLEPWVKRGEVRRLRVVHEMAKSVRINPDKRAFGFQFPVISAGATYAGKDVLGEAEVEPDGSAYFAVPAGLPIYLMALDSEGRAVQRMRSFTHLSPGETQGCIGCHEPRGDTARRSARPLAMNHPPHPLDPPEWGAGGFDYANTVQPVLDTHCAKCHTGPLSPKGVDLSGDKTDFFNVSYETLARGRRQSGEAQYYSPYVSWIPTYNGFETNILEIRPKHWGSPVSKLADIVISRHLDTNSQPRLEMDPASQRRILAWIDLNIPYYGTSETTHPDSAGSRRIYPPALDKTVADVAARRCANCHKEGRIPRQFWTRINRPEWNSFLTAPLAQAAGGTGRCGSAVFQDANDPDYQAILKTFEPALAELLSTPRMDMGGKPNLAVNRSCK